jgi:hypothetical protein
MVQPPARGHETNIYETESQVYDTKYHNYRKGHNGEWWWPKWRRRRAAVMMVGHEQAIGA